MDDRQAGPPAIRIQGLSKYFGEVKAVDGVDFEIARGSICALLGGNGAGKTTTLSILLGLLLPSAGQVELLGENMLTNRYRVLGRINFSSPYVELPYRLTVEQNLLVYARLYGVPAPRDRVATLARELDLVDLLKRRTGSLSAGQKTRVAIAKAMINEPELLLLDEPTASLDPDTADWVRGYLETYRRQAGATVLLASHNMAEVERLCDHVMMMRAGRIVDRGAPRALISQYGRKNLEEVFLDIARGRNGAHPPEAARGPEDPTHGGEIDGAAP